MKIWNLCFAASLVSGPAAAQTVEALPGDGSRDVDVIQQSAERLTPELAKPASPSLKISAQFAPVVAGNAPIRDSDRLSDYQTNSISLTGTLPFAPGPASGLGAQLVLETGLKHNLDTDDDTTDDDFETAYYANSLINWARGIRRFSPFIGVGYERGFRDFFEDKAYGDTKVTGGVRYTTSEYVLVSDPSIKTMWFQLTAAVERSWSSEADRERWTPRLAGELTGPFGRQIAWTLTANGERRIYDRLPTQRRLDWRLTTFAGLELAGLLKKGGPVQKLQVGLRWLYIDSNIPGKSKSTAQLLPVIAIGTKFE